MSSAIRVLVAEDNDDHRFLTERALRAVEDVDVQVEGVRDGQEALDYVHRRGAYADRPTPHLIFLDLRMPRRSGFEVLDALRADDDLATIPVVVLTSSDRPEDIEEAYRRGSNSYVLKPTDGAGLQAGLRCVSAYWTAKTTLPRTASGL